MSRSSSFVSVRNIKSYSEIKKSKSGDLSLVIKPQTLSRTHLILVTAGCKAEFCSVIKLLVPPSSQEDLPSPSYSTQNVGPKSQCLEIWLINSNFRRSSGDWIVILLPLMLQMMRPSRVYA